MLIFQKNFTNRFLCFSLSKLLEAFESGITPSIFTVSNLIILRSSLSKSYIKVSKKSFHKRWVGDLYPVFGDFFFFNFTKPITAYKFVNELTATLVHRSTFQV